MLWKKKERGGKVTINSKKKGKNGELELKNLLNIIFRDLGIKTRRSQQYKGTKESADIEGLPYVHVECKRVEKLNINNAVEKAREEAEGKAMAAVFHRRNKERWKVTMDIEDWEYLYRGFYNSIEKEQS